MAPSKNQSQSQPQQLTPQQELVQIRQQYQAVSELLWETIKTLSPETMEVVVSPHASDPLWELAFVRLEVDNKPDPSGRMRICACTTPEMTESEKKRVVRFLRGTNHTIEEVITTLKIAHPPAYIEAKISDRIKWNAKESIWESVIPADIVEKLKNVFNPPK